MNVRNQRLTAAVFALTLSLGVQAEDPELRPFDMLDTSPFTGDIVSGRDDLSAPLDNFNGGERAHIDGAFTDVAAWPLGAIHSVLLPLGTVLTYGTTPDSGGVHRNSSAFIYDVWNPNLGLAAESHNTLDIRTETNIFCSAHVVLPGTGTVLITGGDENQSRPGGIASYGINDVNIFNPLTNEMDTVTERMEFPRWYPTMTTLTNGEQLVQGGRGGQGMGTSGVTTPEIYNVKNGWRTLNGADSFELWDSVWSTRRKMG